MPRKPAWATKRSPGHPNVAEEALKDLTEEGIVRVGAEVKATDILVGKVTPKSEKELSPEERLLRAIFGEKAADVRDTSLTLSRASKGLWSMWKCSSAMSAAANRNRTRPRNPWPSNKIKDITNRKLTSLSMKRMKKIVQSLGIDKKRVGNLTLDDIEEGTEGREIMSFYQDKIAELTDEELQETDRIRRGDELPAGVLKRVVVYVATKRKLQVGDKMAGRHGNKGIVSRIMPEEDMPFLEDGPFRGRGP